MLHLEDKPTAGHRPLYQRVTKETFISVDIEAVVSCSCRFRAALLARKRHEQRMALPSALLVEARLLVAG